MNERKLFIPCRANDREACPIYPECREDDHHLFARRLGKAAAVNALPEADQIQVRRFIEDPRNKVRSCRDIHQRVLDQMPIPLPPLDYIKEFNHDAK